MQDDKYFLSKIRLKNALNYINTAKHLVEFGDYKTAENRAYYAVFHCMRAVLALDGVDRRKHSGVISEFRHRYIKTNIFDNELSEIVSDTSLARQNSDYDDLYVTDYEKAVAQISNAEIFYRDISEYLTKIYETKEY